MGKQWLIHYKRLGPTAHLENRKTLQRQLDGTIRWHFEGSVEVGLTALLQVALILFMCEWVPYLHWQGNRVSYPVNGLSNFGAFLLVLILGCASWDRWCPYQTPYTTTIPQIIWTLVLRCSNIHVCFWPAVAAIRQSMSGLRSHPSRLLHIFRRIEERDEVIDIKSLCWMLENAPRGLPLLRVAQHISNIQLCRSQGAQFERIVASSQLFRLHETFWYLLMKIKRISGGNPRNANDNTELLQHLSIFGMAIICTSHQWTEGPLLYSKMRSLFKVSFEFYGPRNGTCWEGQSLKLFLHLNSLSEVSSLEICPFLDLQVSCTDDRRGMAYYYCAT